MNQIILLFVAIAEALFARKNVTYGLMCYYCVRIFVPSSARIGNFSFNTTLFFIMLLFALPSLLKKYKQADDSSKKYFKIISLMFIGLFVLTLSAVIPLSWQWSQLVKFFGTEIIPSIVLLIYLTRPENFKTFCKIVCIGSIFTALYGIYTYVTYTNPLFEFFNNSDAEATDIETYATGRFGLTSIAVGIYSSKITLALIALLEFTFLYGKKELVGRIPYYFSLVSLLVVMVLTTQRAPLLALFIFFFYMYWDFFKKKKNRKWIVPVILLIIPVAIIVIQSNDTLNEMFTSVIYLFDDRKQQQLGIGGSSMDMRINQLQNCLDYIGISQLLQGVGYNFPKYYYSEIYVLSGPDKQFYGFESFLFEVVISSGIIGVLIWTVGYYKMYKVLRPNKSRYYTAFFITYMLAILFTNNSGSIYLYFFLTALNYKQILIEEQPIWIKCEHSI